MTTSASFWGTPQWVSEESIRATFNRERLYERVRNGELRQHLFKPDTHLSRRQRRRVREPLCTRSQMLLYATRDGTPMALVHQYLRRTGELGGSGLPDPKRLFSGGTVLAVRQTAPPP